MSNKIVILTTPVILGTVLSAMALLACSGRNTPSPTATPAGPGGGAVVQSDSIITGEIRAVRQQTTGYRWEVDVLVQSSEDVGSLPNPTKDKVGQVITARTDEELSSFKVGQSTTANVKYVGDVPKPGISLYIYKIKAK